MATPEQDDLAHRIRAALQDHSPQREVSMFGALCFMVHGAILVAAQRDGGLLARVDAARSVQLLARDGAGQAEMGTGRSMGPSWITVSPAAVESEEGLAFWIGAALDHHSRIT